MSLCLKRTAKVNKYNKKRPLTRQLQHRVRQAVVEKVPPGGPTSPRKDAAAGQRWPLAATRQCESSTANTSHFVR